MDNYSKLVERIAGAAKLSVGDVERKVEAKRAKLSGLVSKDGAAQIVAAELGVNFDKERLKISELVHGMKRANVVGKVLEVSPVREFNKNGREGKVVNLLVADDSSNCRVVFWDTNHIALVESGDVGEGSVLEISNGSVRNGELHLSSFSDVKKSEEKVEDVVTKKVFVDKKIEEARAGMKTRIRAFIVQSFEPRYFYVSKETGKKVDQDKVAEYSPGSIEKRALLSMVLDDGSETIRAVMFGDTIKGVGLEEEEIFDLGKFAERKMDLLGKEFYFSGNFKSNQLYNTTELMVEQVEEVNLQELVKELEARA